MTELEEIIEKMIEAGESEESIKLVIAEYKSKNVNKLNLAKTIDPASADPTVVSSNNTGSISTDGSLESQDINSFSKAEFSQAQLDDFSLLMEEVVKGVEDVPKREKTTTEKIVEPILDVGNRFMAAGFNIPTQLKSAWEGTKAAAVDWLSTVAGGDAADFLTGEKDFSKAIAFVDPLTNSEITFNSDPERWKELNTLNSKQGVDIKSIYSGTETEIGTSAENYIIDKFRNVKKLNEETLETGSIVKGFKEGDIPEILGGIFNAVGSLVSTAAPAALTRGASLFPQVVSPMYIDFNVTKAETLYPDSEDPISELVKKGKTQMDVPLALGIVATGLEYIGLKGISRQIAGATGKLSPLVSLALTQNKEGLTEVFQLGTEKINTSIAAGKSVVDAVVDGLEAMASEDGLESYAQGVIGSGIISAPSAINKAMNGEKQSVSFINKTINNIGALQAQRSLNKNKSFREAIDIEIREQETSLKNHFVENNNISRSFDENQKKEIISLVEDKDKNQLRLEELKKSFDFNDLTARQYGTAKGIITKNNAKISNKISEIKNSVDLSTLDAQIKTVEKLTKDIKGLSIKSLNNEEAISDFIKAEEIDVDSEKASQQQGFVYQDPKTGDQTIIINKEVAAKEQAVNVAAHEFLHGLLFQTVKNSPETQIALGKSLNEYINNIDIKQIKDSNFTKRLESYKEMDEATQSEEVLTLFSDAIATGDIQFNESVFTKIGDVIRRALQNLGVSIKFNNGKDVYNFIKDYNKSIKKGSLTGAQKIAANKGVKGSLVLGKTEENTTDVKESKSTNATPLEAINALVPNTVKTQAEYFSPRVFNPIYNALEDNGVISNYIKSKSPSKEVASKTIESIRERLVNFNPETTRKNKDNAEPITFGEFIFANTNFGKLDAKKALFKESEEVKKTTDLDNKEAQGKIANEEGYGSTVDNRKKYVPFINNPKMIPNFLVTAVKTKLVDVVSKLTEKLSTRPKGPNAQTTPLIAEIKTAIGNVVKDPEAIPKQIIKRMGKGIGSSYKAYLIANKKSILENMTTTWLQTAIPAAVEKSVGGKFKSDKNGVKLNDKGEKWRVGDVAVFDTNFVPYPEWVGKKIDREKVDTDKIGSTSGNDFVKRVDVSDEIFVANFIGQEGRKDEVKKLSLGKAIAEEIAFEILTKEIAKEGSGIRKAFDKNQLALKEVLVDNIVEQISRDAERGNVKFSSKTFVNKSPELITEYLEGIRSERFKNTFLMLLSEDSNGEIVSENPLKDALIEYFTDFPGLTKMEVATAAAEFSKDYVFDKKEVGVTRVAKLEGKEAALDYVIKQISGDVVRGTSYGDVQRMLEGSISKLDLKTLKDLNKGRRALKMLADELVKRGFTGNQVYTMLSYSYEPSGLGGFTGVLVEGQKNKRVTPKGSVLTKAELGPVHYKTDKKTGKKSIENRGALVLSAADFIQNFLPDSAKGKDGKPTGEVVSIPTNVSTKDFYTDAKSVWNRLTDLGKKKEAKELWELGKSYGENLVEIIKAIEGLDITSAARRELVTGLFASMSAAGKIPSTVRFYPSKMDGTLLTFTELVKLFGRKDGEVDKGVFEHTKPANRIAIASYIYSITGLESDLDILEKELLDYDTAMITYGMDTNLRKLKLQSLMGLNYKAGDAVMGTRYAELITTMEAAGITFWDAKTGEVISPAGTFGKQLNQEMKAGLEPVKTAQKAIDNATSVKWSKSPKKIRVFDFDDTLAKTKSSVLYVKPNPNVGFSPVS